MPKFGPGVLKIGETATAIDVSCLVNGMRITAAVDAGDPTTKLCGTQRPGSRTYSWEMTGNIDIDPEAGDAGIFALSQVSYGTEQKFTFTPNNEAEATATGTLIIDPLDFGADAFGDDLTSDLTWALVDKPTYTYGAVTLADTGTETVGTATEIGDAVPPPIVSPPPENPDPAAGTTAAAGEPGPATEPAAAPEPSP
jgi:hypothetical protein